MPAPRLVAAGGLEVTPASSRAQVRVGADLVVPEAAAAVAGVSVQSTKKETAIQSTQTTPAEPGARS
jgi:hypothetical protein